MSRSEEERAVALKYNPEEDQAPVVIASGYGEIAERIIDIAEGRGIPVYRDDSAASMLCMLQVGTEIPPELYQTVAKIYVEILKIADHLKHPESGTPVAAKSEVVKTDAKEMPVK